MSVAVTPFFSILIPAYNRPELLVAAMQSVLDNTFGDFEIVISEDCSPGQAKVVAKLEGFSDRRVRWFAQKENLGWSNNRNFLVSHARGQFVWLMGDDDLLSPHTLERLHAFISRQPGHDIYACGYEVIDEFDRHQYVRHAAREIFLRPDDPFVFRQLLLSRAVPFWLFHPFTFAYRRELGVQFPYQQAALIGDDLFFLYECFRTRRTIAITPEILFHWRKFTPEAAHTPESQVNLSSAINGIRARAHILDMFTASQDWRTILDDLFPTGNFTRCFLHAAVQAHSGHQASLLKAIRNDSQLAAKFEGYSPGFAGLSKLWIRVSMLQVYVRLNGIRGMGQLLLRLWREFFLNLSSRPHTSQHAP